MKLEDALQIAEVESALDTSKTSLPSAFRPYHEEDIGKKIKDCEKVLLAVREISKEPDKKSSGFTYFIAELASKKIIDRPDDAYIATLGDKDDWVVA
jgi:hypothetical protein